MPLESSGDAVKGVALLNSTELQSWMRAAGISGTCSVHLGERMTLAGAHGYANTTYAMKNTLGTRFATASIGKGFTAVAVLQLIEQGRLNCCTSIDAILPGVFPLMSREVNVWHLLTHTSGFADYFDEEQQVSYADLWSSMPQYTLDGPLKFLPLLQTKAMEGSPGTCFKYNNGAFVILAMVIEQITERPFTCYIAENILTPAGMVDSGYFRMDSLPGGTATGYTKATDGTLRSNIYSIPVIGGGDGGIYSTCQDLYKFWRAMAAHKLLSFPSLHRAWTPQVTTDSSRLSYGLGFWIAESDRGARRIQLIGSDPGVSCRSCYYPGLEAVISVLCNADTGSKQTFLMLEGLLLSGNLG